MPALARSTGAARSARTTRGGGGGSVSVIRRPGTADGDATMADLSPGRWRSAESPVDVPRPAGRRASLV